MVVGIDASQYPEQAAYGAVHEFGSTDHREVAWMRGASDVSQSELSKAIADGLGKAIDNGNVSTAEEAVEHAGTLLRDRARRALRDAGLQDTGALIESVEVHHDR